MTDAVETPSVQDMLAKQLLRRDYDQLNPQQKSVIDLIAVEAPSDLRRSMQLDDRTFWDRLADSVARVGGSWGFIFAFMGAMAVWMGINVVMSANHRWDPYPFILLNLMLSTLAALQAPVIMMSQNRQGQKDREAAEHDYVVNLRAELEIMRLHDKLDAMRDREIVDLIQCQNETLDLLKKQVAALEERIEEEG